MGVLICSKNKPGILCSGGHGCWRESVHPLPHCPQLLHLPLTVHSALALKMDNICVPDQAVLKQPREIYNDSRGAISDYYHSATAANLVVLNGDSMSIPICCGQ